MAVGVIRGFLGSIERYRLSHVRFYTRFEGNLLLASAACAIGIGTAIWTLIDYLLLGYLMNPPLAGVLLFVAPFTLLHLTISVISRRKRKSWGVISDMNIQDIAEQKRERYPLIVEAPSINEMQTTKALAEFGDLAEHEKASILDEAAKSTLRSPLKNAIIAVLAAICIFLLLL